MGRWTWYGKVGRGLLDLVYPPALYCISCGKIIDESRTYRLCNECMEAMNWVTDRHCRSCGRPLSDTNPGGFCFDCSERRAAGFPHAFDKGYACAGYGACEQAAIFSLKYGGRSDIGVTLGEIMYDRMCAEYEPDELAGMYDLVIPVPIFKRKKNKRSFNHAEIMASAFCEMAQLEYDSHILVRTRNTQPMKGLSPVERRDNISGAFKIRERKLPLLSGARILLIDDIFTTGATLDEIATLLKNPYLASDRQNQAAESLSPHGQSHAPGDLSSHGQSHAPGGLSPFELNLDHDSDAQENPGASRVDFLAFAAAADMII